MSRTLSLPRAAGLAALVAVLAFALGFGVRAVADEGETPANDDSADTSPRPATANGSTTAPPARPVSQQVPAGGMMGGAEDADAKLRSSLPYYGGCQVPLGASLDGTLDLKALGLTPRSPGAGFQLLGFSLRRQGECPEDGSLPSSGDLVLDSQWLHTATKLTLNITQAVSAERVPNFRGQAYASFSDGGYAFSVSTGYYYIASVEKPGILPPDETQFGPVIDEALRGLAPSLEAKCFAREVTGGFDDLASFGIGDPRPAIPSGFTLQDARLQRIEPAAAGCDTPPVEDGRVMNFWANWSADGGASWLSINVTAAPTEPGIFVHSALTDQFASWQSGRFAYNVNGYGRDGRGIGVDAIRAIARALDPSFSEQCLVREEKIDESQLAGAGFNAPSLSGWTRTTERLVRASIADGCARPEGYRDGYSGQWRLTKDGTSIVAFADRSIQAVEDIPFGGAIFGTAAKWTNSDGISFAVHSEGGTSVTRDDIIAVAKSMDASFDPAKLQDGGDGGPVRPLPAPDAGVSGGGSAGSAPSTTR